MREIYTTKRWRTFLTIRRMKLMTIEVTISERALESMVLAACEAYSFGKGDSPEAVETYAHLWGTRRCNPDGATEYLYVDRVNMCVSAQVTNDQATVFTSVVALQDDIVKHWSPHVSLLGDFHTHPYDSRRETTANRGWDFSDCDIASFLSDDNLWERADGSPISLVMAVTELRRVHEGWATQQTDYRWRFDIGQYQFYLSAAAGKGSGGKRRFIQRGGGVHLVLGHYFYNRAGNRVGD